MHKGGVRKTASFYRMQQLLGNKLVLHQKELGAAQVTLWGKPLRLLVF